MGPPNGEVLEAFISKALEPRRGYEAKEKAQGQSQEPEETFRGWREAKELTKDVEGSGRENTENMVSLEPKKENTSRKRLSTGQTWLKGVFGVG